MKKGDRVICTSNDGIVKIGMLGTIFKVRDKDVDVDWEGTNEGHSGDSGTTSSSHWYVYQTGIKLLDGSNLKLNYLIL